MSDDSFDYTEDDLDYVSVPMRTVPLQAWQPIATVPYKQDVILTDGKRVTIGWALDQVYEREGAFDLLAKRGEWAGFDATHWMPLPKPPGAA